MSHAAINVSCTHRGAELSSSIFSIGLRAFVLSTVPGSGLRSRDEALVWHMDMYSNTGVCELSRVSNVGFGVEVVCLGGMIAQVSTTWEP